MVSVSDYVENAMKKLTEHDELVWENSFRRRAIRWFPLKDKCERCRSAPAVDRHHKDGNVRRNVASNIAHLCRRCHMIEDGRVEQLVRRNKEVLRFSRIIPPKPCSICSRMSKPTWKGRCHRCDIYLRRHGHEWSPIEPKTHCKFGHEFDESNTWICKQGTRHCRKCHAEREARRRQKRI